MNPVTGGRFLKGETGDDSIAYQKLAARKALLAQEWFALYGPRGAPPLPLTPSGTEDMRREWSLNCLIGFTRDHWPAKTGRYTTILRFRILRAD
jgi:hypothetical protein